MKCPDTPNSVIAGLMNSRINSHWQSSWNRFFEIYYPVVQAMTRNSLKRIGWDSIPENEIDDIMTKTFMSLMKAFEDATFQQGKYKFRGFLKRIVSRRVIDFVRASNRKRTISVEAIELVDALESKERGEKFFDTLESDEATAYRKSVVLDVWENIRRSFSPETCLAFEMAVLEERPIKEICAELNVERSRVDKSIHRIVKKIREEIGKDYYKKELSK